MTRNKLEKEFVNPFTEEFIPIWELWKNYKKAEFKFNYKSTISEQAAVNLLARLSGKNETLATAIIRQSMENGWQGLFPYKNKNNGTYRTGSQSPTAGGQDPTRINTEGFGSL